MNHLMTMGRHWLHTHHTAGAFGGITLGLVLLLVAWMVGTRVLRRLGYLARTAKAKGDRAGWRVEDTLTALIALTATTYAGTGNWQFLSKATHYGTDLKAVLVWVFEGAVVVEGLRARRNILQYGEPGIDGRGLWAFAGASSLLSVSESGSLPEALARLMVPLIAAFLWERLMKAPLDAEAMAAAKKRREAVQELAGEAKPKRRISWRIRPDRIVVWLGLADSADTSTLAAESNRRIMRYVKAAERADRVAAGDKHRLPWTAAAREARAERKLTAHGLLSYADPTEVYEKLARQKMVATLERLGVVDGEVAQEQEAPTAAEAVPTPTSAIVPAAEAVVPASPEARPITIHDLQILAGWPKVSTPVSTPDRVDTEGAVETTGVDTNQTSLTSDVYTGVTKVDTNADEGVNRVDTGSDLTHTWLTRDAEKVDTTASAHPGLIVIPPQVTGVDSERIYLGAQEPGDTPNGREVDTSTSVHPSQVDVWFSGPAPEVDTVVELSDDEINDLINGVDTFDDEDDPEVDTGNRPPAGVAGAIIFSGWSNGRSVSEIVSQSGRSRSFVYKQFKKLDDKHGPRLRDDTTEIPVVTANGTALHEEASDQ